MNLSEPFIRRPVMTVLLTISIVWGGILAYRALPVSDLPSIDFPTIHVSSSFAGAPPETMASAIATPLEQQFMTLEGIKGIFSSSNTGSTSIILQFNLGRNIDAASTDVQAAITATLPTLPPNLPSNPTYRKVDPSSTPVVYFAFTSPNMTSGQLYDYANTIIGQRFSLVEGVAQIATIGAPYAVRIQVDPGALAAMNIGLDEVTADIQNATVEQPTGTLYSQRGEFTIDVDGQLLTAAPYGEIVINNQNGQLPKIKDIGRAFDSVNDDKYAQSYVTSEESLSSVIIAVLKQPGANAVRVVRDINALLDRMIPELPASLEMHRLYDHSETIIDSLYEVKKTLWIAFFLVILIIYLFLGEWVNTLIPVAALPVTILGSFFAMLLFGFNIDIFSLLALTLSIGFLVDDAIVVLENNVRHSQLGKNSMNASIDGAQEISITILSITLCLMAAFIPMIFLTGIIGRLFREFAVTIVTAVAISGIISLTLTPMLCSRLIRSYAATRQKTRIERFSEWFNLKLTTLYGPCLYWAMNHRSIVLMVGLFSILASVYLAIQIPQDFLPPGDQGIIRISTQAREGTSPFLMEKYQKALADIVAQNPAIDNLASFCASTNDNQGGIFVRLKPFAERHHIDAVINELDAKVHQIPGLSVYLSPLPLINLQFGTTAKALYQYALVSLDAKTLYHYAPTLVAKMEQDPKHFSQVSSDLLVNQPQLELTIRRDKAYDLNVNATQIENYLAYAYSNNKIATINSDISQYDVIIETLPRYYNDPSVLSQLYVRSSTNALVPMLELVDVAEIVGPMTINHLNGLPSIGISFNLPDGVALGDAVDALHKLTVGNFPHGVQGSVQGTASVFKDSFAALPSLLLISFFVIYVILGILYENFIHPITVMSALPPALFGGLLTLYIFQESLSVYSFVGLILLIGIVLKNGIMLVDFANSAVKDEKKSSRDAIIYAAKIRFRPILMTTCSALMGALPIALGSNTGSSQAYIPLGLCIAGGLCISQLITLFLTPVLYFYFEELSETIDKTWEKHFSRK